MAIFVPSAPNREKVGGPYKLKNISSPSTSLKLKNCLVFLKILVRYIELPDKSRVSDIGEE